MTNYGSGYPSADRPHVDPDICRHGYATYTDPAGRVHISTGGKCNDPLHRSVPESSSPPGPVITSGQSTAAALRADLTATRAELAHMRKLWEQAVWERNETVTLLAERTRERDQALARLDEARRDLERYRSEPTMPVHAGPCWSDCQRPEHRGAQPPSPGGEPGAAWYRAPIAGSAVIARDGELTPDGQELMRRLGDTSSE